MTHYCSACSQASFNDCLRNQNGAVPHSCAALTIEILQCQQSLGAHDGANARLACVIHRRTFAASGGLHDGDVGGAVMPYSGIVEPCYCAINIIAIILTEFLSTAITLYRLKYSASKIILSIILVKIVTSPVMHQCVIFISIY